MSRSDTLTADDIRWAMSSLPERFVPCRHLVPPQYADWHLTLSGETVDATVRCANLCGRLLCLSRNPIPSEDNNAQEKGTGECPCPDRPGVCPVHHPTPYPDCVKQGCPLHPYVL